MWTIHPAQNSIHLDTNKMWNVKIATFILSLIHWHSDYTKLALLYMHWCLITVHTWNMCLLCCSYKEHDQHAKTMYAFRFLIGFYRSFLNCTFLDTYVEYFPKIQPHILRFISNQMKTKRRAWIAAFNVARLPPTYSTE